jgi:tetratricopeptide (TPR) repeat protein
MKNLGFKITFLLFSLAFVLPAFAQDDAKYGDDPDQCKRDLSEYIEFVKQKSYIDALPAWRRVYSNCPKSSKSIYINGPKIFKALIKAEKDAAKKQAYIDTLMIIYDKRIEHFGQKGSVLGRKGNDLLKYRKASYEEAYGYMKESTELTPTKPQAAVLQNLMKASALMYKNKKIDAGQVVADFSSASDQLAVLFEKDKEKPKKIEAYKKVEENVGKLFISTGAGSCDVLIGHFTPKFEATPQDEELLKTITKYLDKGDCTDSKLFFESSVNLYEISPSAQAAYNIAKMAAKKKDYNKAAKFYNKAIEMEEDDAVKAQYYYELAAVSMTSPASARSYALKAISLKSGWGAPYILIAKLYAGSSSSCGDDKFSQASVFWLAVDVLNQAKSVDASVAADANKLIGQYKQYFPGKEDAFAYNVTEGSAVQIECWINKTTKARF